jgi:hypothetical protein
MTAVATLKDITDVEIAPGQTLLRDLRRITRRDRISEAEAKFLVSSYLALQKHRVAMGNQAKDLRKRDLPNLTLDTFEGALEMLEDAMVGVLGQYARSSERGRWALTITGIGPVIASGLCALSAPQYCRRPQSLWAYAGLTPERRAKYNRQFRLMAYYAGDQMVRQRNAWYRQLYEQRKAREWLLNIQGHYAEQALARLPHAKSQGSQAFLSGAVDPEKLLGLMALGRSPIAANGAINRAILAATPDPKRAMLVPMHIDRRARRWTVKLLLSHFAQVSWESVSDEPWEQPYAISQLGHHDYIAPPNWPMTKGWKEKDHPVPNLYPELELGPILRIIRHEPIDIEDLQ